MDASDLIQILKGTADFAQVDEGSLGELVGAGSVVEPAVGEDIVRQGEVGQRLWILIEGDLEVLVDGEPVNRVSRPGELVGQISAVSVVPATATVRVAGPTRCLAVPSPSLHRLFGLCPGLAEALLRSMAKYLGTR